MGKDFVKKIKKNVGKVAKCYFNFLDATVSPVECECCIVLGTFSNFAAERLRVAVSD